MATKTLIIRPSFFVASAGQVSSIPSDTTPENYYQLVNEETADDTATYISINASSDESIYCILGYEYIKPGNIISVNLFCRGSAQSTSGLNVSIDVLDENNLTISSEKIVNNTPFEGVNNFINRDFSLTDTISALNQITDGTIYTKIIPILLSGTKAQGYWLTQTYLVITYEEVEDQLYIKSSNSWIPLSGSFYQKKNQIWSECTLATITELTKINVKEV